MGFFTTIVLLGAGLRFASSRSSQADFLRTPAVLDSISGEESGEERGAVALVRSLRSVASSVDAPASCFSERLVVPLRLRREDVGLLLRFLLSFPLFVLELLMLPLPLLAISRALSTISWRDFKFADMSVSTSHF